MKKVIIPIYCICLSGFLKAQNTLPHKPQHPNKQPISEALGEIKNILQRNDAWGDTIFLGNSKNDTPVYAYYYNRSGTDCALIMAGVHGSEFLGVDVVDTLKYRLDTIKSKNVKWKILIIPQLFSDNVNESRVQSTTGHHVINFKRCTKQDCDKGECFCAGLDPNRQMPEAGKSYVPISGNYKLPSRIVKEKDIEIENQWLLQLVQVFNPSRIASVHCKNERDSGEIGIYADPRTDSSHRALGYGYDAALAIEMAFSVQDNGGRIYGNFINPGSKKRLYYNTIYPLDASAVKKTILQYRSFQDTVTKGVDRGKLQGVSFGTWASTEIRENGKLVKQAATMITIEMPQYYSFSPVGKPNSPAGIKKKNININAYTTALTDVFLSEK